MKSTFTITLSAALLCAVMASAQTKTTQITKPWMTKARRKRRHEANAARDLATGRGGRDGTPAPPFQFIQEHLTGSNPCVSVRDARNLEWRVKWGAEVHTEVFGSRFAWAAGYFVETNYFVPGGRIEGATSLQRAGTCIDEDGGFRDARFELDEPDVVKHFDEESWAWNENPFVGTHELNGLKIVMMLLSNWDSSFLAWTASTCCGATRASSPTSSSPPASGPAAARNQRSQTSQKPSGEGLTG